MPTVYRAVVAIFIIAALALIAYPGVATLAQGDGRDESKEPGQIISNELTASLQEQKPSPPTRPPGGGGSGSPPVSELETPTSQTVAPGSTTNVVTADGLLTITIPPDAVDTTATVQVAAVSPGQTPTVGAGLFKIGDQVFEITVTDAAGQPVRQFGQALTLTFTFAAADLPAGITPEDLQVFYWDEQLQAWIAVPSERDPASRTITATVDHLTIFAVLAAPDLNVPVDIAGHWSEADVLKLLSIGTVTGFTDQTFRPELPITRAQFAVMLVRAVGVEPIAEAGDGLPAFTDELPAWAGGYVAAAVARGWIAGYEDGTFRPDQAISRQELAVLMARVAGRAADGNGQNGPGLAEFVDADAIAGWAASGVEKAKELGIIGGFEDRSFRPLANATRAQAAAMISRLLQLPVLP